MWCKKLIELPKLSASLINIKLLRLSIAPVSNLAPGTRSFRLKMTNKALKIVKITGQNGIVNFFLPQAPITINVNKQVLKAEGIMLWTQFSSGFLKLHLLLLFIIIKNCGRTSIDTKKLLWLLQDSWMTLFTS